VASAIGRAAFLVFWCFVLWGTLFDLALLRLLLFEGAAAAGAVLRTPADGAFYAWLNRLSGLLAAMTWLLVLGRRWASRAPAA
jgi:hypothetical protein